MHQRERESLSLFLFVRIAQLHPRNAIENIGCRKNTPNPSTEHTRVQRACSARGLGTSGSSEFSGSQESSRQRRAEQQSRYRVPCDLVIEYSPQLTSSCREDKSTKVGEYEERVAPKRFAQAE